jgi:acyl transferase domain-containing protein
MDAGAVRSESCPVRVAVRAAAHDEPRMTTIGLSGFLDGAADFDASFSEREAGAMDPQ